MPVRRSFSARGLASATKQRFPLMMMGLILFTVSHADICLTIARLSGMPVVMASRLASPRPYRLFGWATTDPPSTPLLATVTMNGLPS